MAINPIQPLQPASSITSVQPLKPSTQTEGLGFDKLVSNLSKEMGQFQQQTESEVAKLAAGKLDNVHQVMIAMGKQDVAFNYMLEIRNRLIESYKEVMRMPL